MKFHFHKLLLFREDSLGLAWLSPTALHKYGAIFDQKFLRNKVHCSGFSLWTPLATGILFLRALTNDLKER